MMGPEYTANPVGVGFTPDLMVEARRNGGRPTSAHPGLGAGDHAGSARPARGARRLRRGHAMRVLNLNGRLSLDRGDVAVDVETASGGLFAADVQAVYDRWEEFRAWAGSYDGPADRPYIEQDPRRPGAAAPRGLRHRAQLPGRTPSRRAGATRDADGVHQVPGR